MWQEVHCRMAVWKVWYIFGQHCKFNGSIPCTKYFLQTLKVVYYSQEVQSVRYVGWLILEIASLEKKPSCSNPQMNRKRVFEGSMPVPLLFIMLCSDRQYFISCLQTLAFDNISFPVCGLSLDEWFMNLLFLSHISQKTQSFMVQVKLIKFNTFFNNSWTELCYLICFFRNMLHFENHMSIWTSLYDNFSIKHLNHLTSAWFYYVIHRHLFWFFFEVIFVKSRFEANIWVHNIIISIVSLNSFLWYLFAK